jgi:mannitol/fructose-specific phosphotransferase system IIA component (Ntr-type)
MPQELMDKQKEKAINQAIKLLVSNGIIKNTDFSVA